VHTGRSKSRFVRYAVGVAAVVAALALTRLLEAYLVRVIFVLFWPAIVVAAWYGGRRPALLAIALSVLAVDLFFIPPAGVLVPHELRDLVALAAFGVLAAGIALLTDRLREEHAKVVAAEREAIERAELLEAQAAELEAQTEEAQALTEELEQSNEQLRDLMVDAEAARDEAERASAERNVVFDAIPDAVIVLDEDWRYRHLNPTAAAHVRTAGARVEELIGRTPWEAFSEERVAWLRREGRRAAQERRIVEFEEVSRVDWRWYRHRIIPTKAGYVLHSRDVSVERRRDLEQHTLADAGALLKSSMNTDATVTAVAQLAVPALADWCSVTIVRADGALEQAAVAHADPEKTKWARELNRRFPTDPRSPHGVAEVVRTGRPVLWPVVSDALLAEVAVGDDHVELLRAAGLTSAMIVPLAARGGTLGALTMATAESGRRYADADLALAEELGRRIGVALENAALFEAERAARTAAEAAAERTARLQAVTAALSHATTVGEVARVAADQGMAALGADDGVVCLVTPDGDELEIVHEIGLVPGAAETFRRFPIAAPLPLSEALRTGEPVFLENRADVVRRYPALADANRRAATEAWVMVPLPGDRGPLGGLAFGFRAARTLPEPDRELVLALARQCGIAFERARLLESERRARAEAEAANRAKTDFLAVMSHELRTPLNAIAGHTELVEIGIHGPVTDAQRDALARIQRSQRHLLGLINDVLNFAKLEAGHVEYDIGEVPLHETVEAIEPLVSSQLRAKALRLVPCDCADHPIARGDREKVRQVLLNLLSNAIKFTPEGGTIVVECVLHDGRVGVRVSDTGIGIPAEKLEQIFAPFVQVNRALSTMHEGTGLGLAISRDLARGMGGDLTVDSTEGEGSAFTLFLPVAQPRSAASTAALAS
jgi:signal transduction histidine kinase/PAS domain-containing protein